MTIWTFQRAVSRRLATWAAVSATLGGFMSLGRSAFWRGVGAQFIGWAVVNLAIALFGQRAALKRERRPDAHNPAVLRKEASGMFTLLWFNAGLDILYMIGGAWLARRAHSDGGKGTGVGIILQGLFLFVFDVIHGLRVPRHDHVDVI
jgi:hypothetical protein